MYQTLLAESEIHIYMENTRNATSHPVCWKKLSSLRIFLLNEKGSAINEILLLYNDGTPLFLLLNNVEEGLDLEEDWVRCCSHLALWVPKSSRRKSLRVLDPLQFPYLCLFMVFKAVMTTVRNCDMAGGFCYSAKTHEEIAEPGATALLSLLHGMSTTQDFPSNFMLLVAVHRSWKVYTSQSYNI